jgi:hypothetical protein
MHAHGGSIRRPGRYSGEAAPFRPAHSRLEKWNHSLLQLIERASAQKTVTSAVWKFRAPCILRGASDGTAA